MSPAPELQLLGKEEDLNSVTETIIRNYGLYHEISIQLESLQNWIKEQQKLWNNKKD